LVQQLHRDLSGYLSSPEPLGLDLTFLESTRGFLIHMQQVYPSLTPYLKGLHLTIDSWRPNRDSEGWKCPGNSSSTPELFDDSLNPAYPAPPLTDPPQYVHPVPRYEADVMALQLLLSAPDPPLRYVRQNKILTAIYGFVNASASGFGSSFTTHVGTHYTYGVWGRDHENQSSNYWELSNLVTPIERLWREGTLDGAEVFVFTDNFTAESAFYKGNTTSKALFELVLRLWTIEMQGVVQLRVIHIAGTRMIWQGTDGLSRGSLTEGVMSGMQMLDFVPLHLSALD
jgi:hypothetical protein